jgi:hypothetical protein
MKRFGSIAEPFLIHKFKGKELYKIKSNAFSIIYML